MTRKPYRLKLCSYNSNGSGFDRRLYIKDLYSRCDILLLQEHWLYSEHLNSYTNDLENANICGTSPMKQNELLKGRPFGGTAFIWRSDSKYKVTPIDTMNDRISFVKIQIDKYKLLLFNVYMPCDNYGLVNKEIYDNILVTIASLCDTEEHNAVIIGGDFNTDLVRLDSSNTRSLYEFFQQESLHCLSQNSSVDYTFESRVSHERSLIDHFLVSENLNSNVKHYSVRHDALNGSDHSPVVLDIDIDTSVKQCNEMLYNKSNDSERLLWDKATPNDIENYEKTLEEILLHGEIYPTLQCNDLLCTNEDHKSYIHKFYNYLTDASVLAGWLTIPSSITKKPYKKSIQGWNAYVRNKQHDAIFWHNIWKSAGSPQHGVLADLRHSTRSQYHQAEKSRNHIHDPIR